MLTSHGCGWLGARTGAQHLPRLTARQGHAVPQVTATEGQSRAWQPLPTAGRQGCLGEGRPPALRWGPGLCSEGSACSHGASSATVRPTLPRGQVTTVMATAFPCGLPGSPARGSHPGARQPTRITQQRGGQCSRKSVRPGSRGLQQSIERDTPGAVTRGGRFGEEVRPQRGVRGAALGWATGTCIFSGCQGLRTT